VVVATKSVILSQKIQLIEFLAIFFCDFFSHRITCVRVAAHAIFAACWQRDNSQKIASPSQDKNRSLPRMFPFTLVINRNLSSVVSYYFCLL